MADNTTQIADMRVSVVKVEPVAKSAAGKAYKRFTVVHEVGADKTFLNAVAFGVLAKALGKNGLAKGNRLKVSGGVSQKEYQKRDNGGVGVENKLIVNSVTVSNGNEVVTLDEFSA